MSPLTFPQLEQLSLVARLSRERADYATKGLLAQADAEKAVYNQHVTTLERLLADLVKVVETTP